MAPQNKPMPTSSSMRSPLDPRYAEAMSNLYQGIKQAAAQGLYSPTDVKRNFDQFKRVTRVLFSQGDNFIIPFLEGRDPKTLSDPQVAKKLSTEAFGKLSKEPAQKAMNYAPGIIEGHHPVSVESIFEAGRHLINQGRWDDYFEYLRYLNNEYGVGGTVAESMYPMTKFAHQWKGGGTVDQYGNPKKPSPIPSAHTTPNPWTLVESEGFPVEMTWGKEYDYSDINDPRKLGDVFMEQSGFPQMMMADKAMDSPQEMGFRKELAKLLGIRERELYSLGKDFKAQGALIKERIKERGITNDVIQEMAYRHYGLPFSVRSTADVPKSKSSITKTTKSAVVPTFAEAEQFAKDWYTEADKAFFLPEQGVVTEPDPAVTRSQSLGKTAAAIANREPVPQTKPVAAPQPKVGQTAVINGKPVVWSGGKWMPVPAPKVKLADTPNVKPNPKPAPRVIPTKPKAAAQPTKPVRVIPSRTQPVTRENPRNQGSASMQIRRMQNTAPDALFIYPGMGLPSNSLIQGI